MDVYYPNSGFWQLNLVGFFFGQNDENTGSIMFSLFEDGAHFCATDVLARLPVSLWSGGHAIVLAEVF
jgi:hypothetical protein